jgi:hypothetical protein
VTKNNNKPGTLPLDAIVPLIAAGVLAWIVTIVAIIIILALFT